ncbi:AAA family ATPase [Desulfosporosinus lacus]|uniref:MoxR-like ATPase n=1 Tax=Desulfosporosinus lacus DSM 15449 TaxID=1121420 RepID=A0A1M5Z810_9FIRM|nr:MoxR family ATPase [Desulfosporosinus lacus]SHI20228.1 MoxR-like ATPase [Desulfosporosinus lacus DSM 15449]
MLPSSLQRLKENISGIVLGKEDSLTLLLVGFIAEGHVLIEDVPGVGKTLIAKALAASLNADFHRIQCTPDLTPTDVTGFYVFDRQSNSFSFRAGPVVTNILLVDEINRTVPRTQSSLLEAMEERQITIDGQTTRLPHPFFVVATQNPIEHDGTFPLPEAQLDRFMLKISMGYPNAEDEENLLLTHGKENPLLKLQAVGGEKDVKEWQELSRNVFVHQSIRSYIIELVRATRTHSAVAFGASPRASLALVRAARALALLRGRKYVIPDDIKYLAGYVLNHRLLLKREDRLRGVKAGQVLEELLAIIPVPVEKDGD